MTKFIHLINKLRLNNIIKQNKIKLTINKKELNLIKLLISVNIIKYIKKDKKLNQYTIIINPKNNCLKYLKIISKPSCLKFITYQEIEKITFKKNWILILSTNKGLTTNLNMNRNTHKLGGVLLFIILN